MHKYRDVISMAKAGIAGRQLAVVLVVLLAVVVGGLYLKHTLEQEEEPAAVTAPSTTLDTHIGRTNTPGTGASPDIL
jgi:hypothetical protein